MKRQGHENNVKRSPFDVAVSCMAVRDALASTRMVTINGYHLLMAALVYETISGRVKTAAENKDCQGERCSNYANHDFCFFTVCDNHCKPSNRPSPVVAQLFNKYIGTRTNNLEIEDSPRMHIPRPITHLV